MQLARPVSLKPHNDHVVRVRRKGFAPKRHSVDLVLDRSDRPIEVQLAPVTLDPFMTGECQRQVAEGLVRFLTVRAVRVDAHEFPVTQFVRFTLFALEEQLAQHGQVLDGPFVCIIVRLAREQSVVVELVTCFRRAAENHRS